MNQATIAIILIVAAFANSAMAAYLNNLPSPVPVYPPPLGTWNLTLY